MTKPMPRLIGVSGYAGSGKNAFADALVAQHGYELRSFAEPLRQMLYATDPRIPSNIDRFSTVSLAGMVDLVGWDTLKREYPEARRLLQTLGTEGGRGVLGENVWVDAAFKDIDEGYLAQPQTERVVFADTRFRNEAQAIRDRGGILVRVERAGTKAINGHSSETDLDDIEFDYVVQNDSTITDLRQKAFDVIAKEQGTYVWPDMRQCIVVPHDVRVFRSPMDLAWFTMSVGRLALKTDGNRAERRLTELVDQPTTEDVGATTNTTENGLEIDLASGHSRRTYGGRP